MKNKNDQLQQIPGVGPSLAEDLRSLGITQISDLQNQDPEKMYQQLTEKVGVHVDRCVLYVFRCAVYFAQHKHHDHELLKWWNWKD